MTCSTTTVAAYEIAPIIDAPHSCGGRTGHVDERKAAVLLQDKTAGEIRGRNRIIASNVPPIVNAEGLGENRTGAGSHSHRSSSRERIYLDVISR
jgi:hypothetical protein